jgi:hypothetical protein
MKEIIVRAAGGYPKAIVEPLTIIIDGTIPTRHSLLEYREMYKEEALKLVDALFETLPGGTFDAMLAEMLIRKASVLRVSYQEGGAR